MGIALPGGSQGGAGIGLIALAQSQQGLGVGPFGEHIIVIGGEQFLQGAVIAGGEQPGRQDMAQTLIVVGVEAQLQSQPAPPAPRRFAYVLIDGIRRVALKKTTLAKAVPNTIRLKLLKLGAKVINSVRRIKLSLPDACPYKDLFFKAHAALAPP